MSIFDVDTDKIEAHITEEWVETVAKEVYLHFYDYHNDERDEDLRWINGQIASTVNEYITEHHFENPEAYAGTPQYDEYIWVSQENDQYYKKVDSFSGEQLSAFAIDLHDELDSDFEDAVRHYLFRAVRQVATEVLNTEQNAIEATGPMN